MTSRSERGGSTQEGPMLIRSTRHRQERESRRGWCRCSDPIPVRKYSARWQCRRCRELIRGADGG
jgi:hypothetical protein